ncbi:proton-conducting transporter membrane subunit [Aliiglaciecola sp. CAU 1673]|uniref:proton-conducting transporter transmembrane domain-containing protein n=1 Tax=Aliiglaciecola sp. CAU 1673 TaxID=3032595 RepID=UPI0023DA8558|nr:proton-conducting transporter membrane subunit [Aliiglaciecola sp. CAU 1673]MDF2179846.1 proton-conducting transporter membrane subunit [Aliiglaciecola sp. CAU 1673]
MSLSLWLGIGPLIPLLGALAVGFLGRQPNLRDGFGAFTALMLLLWSITGFVQFNLSHEALLWNAPLIFASPIEGIPLAFSIEPLGLCFALLASSLWLITHLYAIGYMRAKQESHQTRFYVAFCLAMACLMGLILADNLLTLFLFYELLTLTTYPLVSHKGDEKTRKNARLYLMLLMGSSLLLLLPGILVFWQWTGSLNFTPGGLLDKDQPGVALLYLLFVLGVAKAAVMPLHRWLPAAMVAPTPVSALLHAVAVVKAGVFTLLKVTLYLFGAEVIHAQATLLLWLPALTILLASFVAMTRDNLKERLAYSTISQLSYIVLGTVLANSMGLLGGALQMLMHGMAKISLFFVAGVILIASGKTNISELTGLGRQMPLPFIIFTLASLSVIGLPPFGGLWSKWYLALGTVEAGQYLLLGVLMLSSLLNIAYLLSVPLGAFRPSAQPFALKKVPLSCQVSMALPALACILLFFAAEPLIQLLRPITG